MPRWTKCRRIGRRGIAATEFALVAPVMVLLLLGSFDLANHMQTAIRLERAASAGAQYATINSSDMAAVRQQVLNAVSDLSGVVVSQPEITCECVVAPPVACNTPCPGGMVRTIEVMAQRTITPLLLTTMPLATGRAVARL